MGALYEKTPGEATYRESIENLNVRIEDLDKEMREYRRQRDDLVMDYLNRRPGTVVRTPTGEEFKITKVDVWSTYRWPPSVALYGTKRRKNGEWSARAQYISYGHTLEVVEDAS